MTTRTVDESDAGGVVATPPVVDALDCVRWPLLIIRGIFGGILMGLANLVPGISGGTMLLAAGIYTQFIDAVSQVTALRLRQRPIVLLGCVVLAALAAILMLARPVQMLVIDHRWVMYSLFIGLTLGGLPVVWRLIDRATAGVWIAAAAGFAGMATLAILQQTTAGSAADNTGWIVMLIAGIAGASAMILPGISGGYLWLVLGVYVPILGGIAAFRDGLHMLARDRSIDGLIEPTLHVVLPVGLGVVLGIVVVSHLLKFMLARWARPTLGVLMGLLLGSVVGLYPFMAYVEPVEEMVLKGQTVTLVDDLWVYLETQREVKREDYPTAAFRPGVVHLAGAGGLILAGLATTLLIARISRRGEGERKEIGDRR